MAFRNLGRNRRRTLLSALAVSMGLALLLLIAAILNGEMEGALQNSIEIQSGHLQVRAASYDENKVSLDWKDLIASPNQVVEQIKTIPQVVLATPRLFATGILTLGENSRGVQVIGIDPDSAANNVFRKGLVSGEFLTADDREGILIGKPLAEKFHLNVNDQISLLVNTSNGDVSEQLFTVRGIYTTNTSTYDEGTVFMPLAKAQTITGAQDHASTIFVMLQDRSQADAVAAALKSPDYKILTWRQSNELIVQTEDLANAFLVILYLIILGITATVVTNTLIMAVFERTREIGVLSAIGLKGRRILLQFLTEGGLIAIGGIIGGLILGTLANIYFGEVGISIAAAKVSGILMHDTIYASPTLQDTIDLTIITFVVTILASLYPAVLAAQTEPVEALHGQ